MAGKYKSGKTPKEPTDMAKKETTKKDLQVLAGEIELLTSKISGIEQLAGLIMDEDEGEGSEISTACATINTLCKALEAEIQQITKEVVTMARQDPEA